MQKPFKCLANLVLILFGANLMLDNVIADIASTVIMEFNKRILFKPAVNS